MSAKPTGNFAVKYYCLCPWCDEDTGAQIVASHMEHPRPTHFGPWYCDECGRAFDVLIDNDGVVILSKNDTRQFVSCYVLLRRGDLFFIMRHRRYVENGGDTDATGSVSFYFEEHSCPTNWLGNTAEVIASGESDPHGFLQYVRHIDTEAVEDKENSDWRAMFPEAFQ